jgi:hypothetical protein
LHNSNILWQKAYDLIIFCSRRVHKNLTLNFQSQLNGVHTRNVQPGRDVINSKCKIASAHKVVQSVLQQTRLAAVPWAKEKQTKFPRPYYTATLYIIYTLRERLIRIVVQQLQAKFALDANTINLIAQELR